MKSKIHAFLKAKRHWLFPLLLVLAAVIALAVILLVVPSLRAEAPVPSTAAEIHTEAVTEPVTEAAPVTETETEPPLPEYVSHTAYMHGTDSFFRPERLLTRAEAADLIYQLFGGNEEAEVYFDDVSEDSTSYHEIISVSAYFPIRQEGSFLPDEPTLREDLFAAICGAAGLELPDALADKDAPYTAFALQNGWFYADAASDCISRGEAAHVFNRVTGRSADRALLLAQLPFVFIDVSPLHPYYTDIMEAAVSHEYLEGGSAERWNETEFAALESGLYLQDGVAYYLQEDGTLLTAPGLNEIPSGTALVADESGLIYADQRLHLTPEGVVFCCEDGTILKSESRNDYIFDENGFYTSGDETLDGYVQAVIDECTTEDMAQLEKLRACYDYVRGFSYLGRNRDLDSSVQTMPQDLAIGYALKIFETGKGDCYNYAAAFLFLARRLGYDAEAIIGYCGYTWSRNAISHSWIAITMDDGEIYLFDPQIENYNDRVGISNESYGAFMTTYELAHAHYYPN